MKALLWMVSLLFFATTGFADQSSFKACNQPYALCTTATCKPVPGNKNQSVCSCIVQDGPSLGQLSCDERKPTTSANGQLILKSNFSFQNSATNKIMTCGSGRWTNCLDKPCVVDPQNSNQAICMCDIVSSSSFITFGGECNTASCHTTLYSGASMAMFKESSRGLKGLNLSAVPIKSCPAK